MNVIVTHIRASGEAHTNLEQSLTHAVDIRNASLRGLAEALLIFKLESLNLNLAASIDRLLMHGFPQRTSLNLSLVHNNT